MNFKPTAHGQKMTDWLIEKEVSALFCGCGLGKTGATLAYIDHLLTQGLSRGALIVAPVRVCSITWPNEIRKWDKFNWLKVAHLRTEAGRKAWRDGSADIYLINPEQLPKIVKLLFKGKKSVPVDTFIWDELSQAKNHASKRVNAIRPFMPWFRQRHGLTGTPVPNNYLDLFAQVRLLDQGDRLGRSVTSYRDAWFESDYMGYSYTIKEGAKERIDAKLSDFALVLESEDYLDVPQVTATDEVVSFDTDTRSLYRKMEKELLLELSNSDVVAPSAAALTMKLVQITSGCVYGLDEDDDQVVNEIHDIKLRAVGKLCKQHRDEPVLILSMFRHEKKRLLNLPGAVEFHERHMDDWRAGKIKIFVAHPAQLSHGIDGLQDSCRIAVWASLTYSNEAYLQTNARLIRTGQKKQTIIYRVLVNDTIDDAVAEALRTKSGIQSGLMNALKALQMLRGKEK